MGKAGWGVGWCMRAVNQWEGSPECGFVVERLCGRVGEECGAAIVANVSGTSRLDVEEHDVEAVRLYIDGFLGLYISRHKRCFANVFQPYL